MHFQRRHLHKLLQSEIIAVHISHLHNKIFFFCCIQDFFEFFECSACRFIHMYVLSVVCRHLGIFEQMDLVGLNRHRLDGGGV